jgi:thiamine-phosphate pyrophosphorylase
MKHIDWSVYIVTDQQAAGERALPEIVRAAIQGGATAVQLRAKVATTREMVALGQALLAITRPASIPLIVNDRLDVALAIEADGAHVGQDDLPAAMARQILGPERILGVSAETVAQAQQAERDGANYLGVGDVFGTPSKPDAGSPIGIDGLAATVRAVALPVVAIGGITLDNAPAVIAVGAVGVAVISAVVGAADPAAAARQLRERISLPRNAQT